MAARAFVIPTRFDAVPGSASQITISYQAVCFDGTSPIADFASTFTYDATLTPAANLSAAKAKVVSDCASVGYPGMAASGILIAISFQ